MHFIRNSKNYVILYIGGGTMQKILIVEDDIDIQDILKKHMIDAGYEVAVASRSHGDRNVGF